MNRDMDVMFFLGLAAGILVGMLIMSLIIAHC